MKLDHYCFQVSTPREDQKKRRKKGLHGKFEKFLYPKSSEDQKKRRKKGLHEKFEKFLYPKSSEDQKKRSSPKLEQFLSPKTSEDQKKVQKSTSAQMQTIVKLLGGYIPPSPRVLAPLLAIEPQSISICILLFVYTFLFFIFLRTEQHCEW